MKLATVDVVQSDRYFPIHGVEVFLHMSATGSVGKWAVFPPFLGNSYLCGGPSGRQAVSWEKKFPAYFVEEVPLMQVIGGLIDVKMTGRFDRAGAAYMESDAAVSPRLRLALFHRDNDNFM